MKKVFDNRPKTGKLVEVATEQPRQKKIKKVFDSRRSPSKIAANLTEVREAELRMIKSALGVFVPQSGESMGATASARRDGKEIFGWQHPLLIEN